jgi:phage baseplate assembly protein W
MYTRTQSVVKHSMVEFKRTLGLEGDGDIYRDGQEKAVFYDGPRGVRQELKITLSTVKGEQPFAPDFGLDVFEAVGGTAAVLKREIRLALQDDDRIQSIDSIEVDITEPENRIGEVTVNLTLVDDTSIQIQEEVNA